MILEQNQNPEEDSKTEQFKDSDIRPDTSKAPRSAAPKSDPGDDIEGIDYSKGDTKPTEDEEHENGKKYNTEVKENHPHEIENGDQDGLNPYPDELDPTIKK